VIIVDSNVWIFAEDASTDEHQRAARRVEEAVQSEFGINPIIASEVYHRLSRVFGASVAQVRLINILDHPAGRWLMIQVETIKRAVALAAKAKLRINDAIIAQQALDAKIAVLTGDVRDFRKVKGLKVIPL
jgi:predicted nucleic acid-binding protein